MLHDLHGKEIYKRAETCIHITDSLCCTVEINTVSINWALLVAQMIKNSPAMQETWVLSVGQEDPLEKGMATHSSILA